MDKTVFLGALWARVWAARRPIATLAITATLVVGAIAFLLPPWYRADAEILPPVEEDTGLGISSLLRGAGVPGIKVPTQVTPADVFMVVLESRHINEEIVQRYDLKRLYKKKLMVDTVKELLSHARFKLTVAGTIQISVEDRDPKRAAAMANTYVELLDQFNRQSRMSKGRRTRMFIEKRLADNRADLAAAESRLVEYQARHKTVALSSTASSAVQEAARLVARRMALEVRLGVIQSYSRGSEEELQISQEIAQIDRQMSALPETGLELARLVRDVKVQEQVFDLLTAQYEEARITEARDVMTVDLLDVPTPPERKSRPQRGVMIASAFLLSVAIGMGLAILKREEPAKLAMRMVASE
jgi:uncharacterized protein involved in exopolysaccharide biosynthesis